MKTLDKYNRVCGYLNKIFGYANEYFFDNQLEMPVITLTPTETAYGHVTTSKVWKKADGTAQYELNISSYYLNRDISGSNIIPTVVTLLHESCHIALMQGIDGNEPDLTGGTCMNGIYHNKSFKRMAEERAKLAISRSEKYGYTISEATEETLDFILKYNLEDILLNRDGVSYVPVSGESDSDKPVSIRPKTKSNSRKWVCPTCGLILRSTKDSVHVMCLDCNQELIRA